MRGRAAMPSKLNLIFGLFLFFGIASCSNNQTKNNSLNLTQGPEETLEQFKLRLYEARYKKAFDRTQEAIEKYGYDSQEYQSAVEAELRASNNQLKNTNNVLQQLNTKKQIIEQKNKLRQDENKLLHANIYAELDVLKFKENTVRTDLDIIKYELDFIKNKLLVKGELELLAKMEYEQKLNSSITSLEKLEANEKHGSRIAQLKLIYADAYNEHRIKSDQFIKMTEELTNILSQIASLKSKINLLEQE